MGVLVLGIIIFCFFMYKFYEKIEKYNFDTDEFIKKEGILTYYAYGLFL